MDESVIVEESTVIETVEVVDESVVSITEETIQIISEGIQGPEGIPGPQGEKGEPGGTAILRPAGIDISGHRFVVLDGQGRAIYASNTDQTHATRIVGMTAHAAITDALVELKIYGEITEPTWSWDTSLPVYLGANGLLTQTPPEAPAAKFSVVVGFPISSTTLFVSIGIPISII